MYAASCVDKVATAIKLWGILSTRNALQAVGGSFDRSSLNVFVVNIGMWDGVFRLKLGSWTSAVAHIALFRNMEADASLSKYAVVLFGSGGSSSGSGQPGDHCCQ